MDVQKVVAGILEKVAAKKEEEKKVEKKEDKKEIVKGMSSCKYAHSIADALDEISDNFEYNFGSELDKAQKLAYESPNTLARSTATGANFKDKNEHRDAMAVGEDPAMGDRGNENGITPNHLKTTLAHPPGGKEKVDPAHPPLYNKTADTYQKILKKLAGDKTAYESPNALRTMTVTDSGAGQQGYDSGKSDGNNLRHLIHTSNEKAMDYTKADAKKDYIKEQMSQVFDEVHPEKDTAVDRFIDRGADTSKLAGMKDIASKAKDVASRGVELAKGGKKQFMMGADKHVMNARPGNTAQGFKGKTTRTEAAKSTAVRAGVAGAAGAAGYGAHKAMDKKADEETVSKMERLVKEEKKDEKVEEKIHPGLHKEVDKAEHKKEAEILNKLANILASYKQEKTAIIGDMVLGTVPFSLPLSAGIGYMKGKKLGDQGKPMDDLSVGAMLGMPLHYGVYRLGKNVGHNPKKDSEKTAGAETSLGDGSAVAPGGMDVGQAVPQEAGAPTAGTPEQIEKLKKILLMMQLKKQQEEAAMAQAQQGNMQVPPEMTAQTSPGAVQGI